MNNKEYDIKLIVFLIYLKSYRDSYNYFELKGLLELTNIQLSTYIDDCIKKGYISNECGLEITAYGNEYLEKYSLDRISIDELYEPKKHTLKKSESRQDIYIPENFRL